MKIVIKYDTLKQLPLKSKKNSYFRKSYHPIKKSDSKNKKNLNHNLKINHVRFYLSLHFVL